MNRAQSVSSAGDASTVPVNYKRMAALIRKLLNMEESFYFRRPVDPIADGVPTYYQEIQFPMDLGTMQMKLNNAQYRVQSELNDDFEQIVTNCKIFNPPGTVPVLHAEALQRVWWSEASKAGKLSYQEKRALQGMMNRLRQKPRYVWQSLQANVANNSCLSQVLPSSSMLSIQLPWVSRCTLRSSLGRMLEI
jgi:transcription initiation factor TFIID subunit 2